MDNEEINPNIKTIYELVQQYDECARNIIDDLQNKYLAYVENPENICNKQKILFTEKSICNKIMQLIEDMKKEKDSAVIRKDNGFPAVGKLLTDIIEILINIKLKVTWGMSDTTPVQRMMYARSQHLDLNDLKQAWWHIYKYKIIDDIEFYNNLCNDDGFTFDSNGLLTIEKDEGDKK